MDVCVSVDDSLSCFEKDIFFLLCVALSNGCDLDSCDSAGRLENSGFELDVDDSWSCSGKR